MQDDCVWSPWYRQTVCSGTEDAECEVEATDAALEEGASTVGASFYIIGANTTNVDWKEFDRAVILGFCLEIRWGESS